MSFNVLCFILHVMCVFLYIALFMYSQAIPFLILIPPFIIYVSLKPTIVCSQIITRLTLCFVNHAIFYLSIYSYSPIITPFISVCLFCKVYKCIHVYSWRKI